MNRVQSHYLGSLELRRSEASPPLDTFILAEPHGYRFDPPPGCVIEPEFLTAHAQKRREATDTYGVGVALWWRLLGFRRCSRFYVSSQEKAS